MKKLLLLLLLGITIGGCSQSGKETSAEADSTTSDSATARAATEPAANDITCETLNGFSQDSAKILIENFEKSTVKKHVNQSFFIDKKMLAAINDMLVKERQEAIDAGKKYKTDGIRFYFGKNTPDATEVKLILVSTTDSIEFSQKPYETMHHDYYCHLTSRLNAKPLIVETESATIKEAQLRKPVENDDFERHNTCDGVNQDWVISKAFGKLFVQSFKGEFRETKAVWFGLERFSNMLEEAKFAGLRIYLAELPAHKTTLVLTTVDASKIEYFDCIKTKFINEEKTKDKTTIAKILGDTQDNGSLCPINCN